MNLKLLHKKKFVIDKKNKIKARKSQVIAMSIMFVFFALMTITYLYPFYWVVINSLKTRYDFIMNIWGLPNIWQFKNYLTVFQLEYNGVNIVGMITNTVIFMVSMTSISMFFTTITAYTVSRYNFFGKRALYTFQFILMFIPMVGNMAAVYKFYHQTGLYDTYIGLMLTSTSGFGMGFVMLYAFFQNVSWSYAEAAFIDGAGHFTVMFKIMIPMVAPAIIALAIRGAIGIWGEYMKFYLYAPSKVTLAYGLFALSTANKFGKISYPELFSALIISALPVLVVYSTTQGFITRNTQIGGIKG